MSRATEPLRDRDATDVNLEYYARLSPGRLDYWQRMAAPRFRIRTLLNLIDEFKPSSLVDLGCGSGELLFEVRDRYPDVVLCGVDISAQQIEANRSRDNSVEWDTVDLDRSGSIPRTLSGRFDAVIASEIIEHVENPKLFLQRAFQLARPDKGKLLLSTQSGKIWETERRVGHQRHFGAEEMDELLVSAGWEPIRIWNCGFPFHDLSKRFANIHPDRTMESFSTGPYGPFQKAICFALRVAYKFNSQNRGAQLFAVARRAS